MGVNHGAQPAGRWIVKSEQLAVRADADGAWVCRRYTRLRS